LIATLHALIEELRSSLAAKDAEIAELRRALLGPRSERQKPASGRTSQRPQLSDDEKQARREAAKTKREDNRGRREEAIDAYTVDHPAAGACPRCGQAGPFTELSPELSSEIEYVEERLVRLLHVLQKQLCGCGHIFSAPAPARVADGALYGPALHAYVVVSKCADALPLHRISKRLARAGVHVARSSLTDIFHRTAELLEPVYRRLLEVVAASAYVNADETSQPVMDKDQCRRGFIWTFIAETVIAYVFSADRGGETPARILADTTGFLQVDGHTGYNVVCVPEGRERVGCLAHARRYFHKARDQTPDEAETAMEFIRQVYRVELDAAERNILGTEAHRLLRRERTKPVLEAFHAWLEPRQEKYEPKSPPGRAFRYTLNQWARIARFVDDPKLRADNNISEGALRIIALGRDNFRWVGNDVAGNNLAVLQTIVSTCVANDVNPLHYIADVLMRVASHPKRDIDELLPMYWSPLSSQHGHDA
jgi:transposase